MRCNGEETISCSSSIPVSCDEHFPLNALVSSYNTPYLLFFLREKIGVDHTIEINFLRSNLVCRSMTRNKLEKLMLTVSQERFFFCACRGVDLYDYAISNWTDFDNF